MIEDNTIIPYNKDRKPIAAVDFFYTNYPAKHKFEVPFNGDTNLIKIIGEEDVLKGYTKFMYLPCAKEHGIVTSPGDRTAIYNDKITTDIIRLMQSYGIDPCILIQRGVDLTGMEFYVNLGVKYFTIGNDFLAEQARQKWGQDIYITGSITNVRSYEDFFEFKKDDLYDMIILHFGFNKHLEHIKYLPPWHDYGIIVNDLCVCNCPAPLSHGFGQKYSTKKMSEYDCQKIRNEALIKKESFNKIAYIRPQDLDFFSPYISTYKLADRMSSTREILESFVLYVCQEKQGIYGDEKMTEEDYQADPFEPKYNICNQLSDLIKEKEDIRIDSKEEVV